MLSGKFSVETCTHLIRAISNVSGDSNTAITLFKTIHSLYTSLEDSKIFGDSQCKIDLALVKTLIDVALKAPIILEETCGFLLEIECYEGI